MMVVMVMITVLMVGGRRRHYRWCRQWSESRWRMLHIFTTILKMMIVSHYHLYDRITRIHKFSLHLLVLTWTAQQRRDASSSSGTRYETETERAPYTTGSSRVIRPAAVAIRNTLCPCCIVRPHTQQQRFTVQRRSEVPRLDSGASVHSSATKWSSALRQRRFRSQFSGEVKFRA
jgi:hypothetical protein